MSFHPIPNPPGAEADVIHLDGGRIGVIIDHGEASLAMHDSVTGARSQCLVDREQLLAVAGLMAEAAERLRAQIPA